VIEEHKKLLFPTAINSVIIGVIIAILLVNVPKAFGIRLTSEVYAERLEEMNEKEMIESNSRFYPDESRCEF